MALPTTPSRLLLAVIAIVLLDGLLLFALAELFDTWSLDDVGPIVGAAVVVGLANGLALYAASRVPLEMGALALGATLVAINVLAIIVGGLLFAGEMAIVGGMYTAVLGGLSTLLLAWFFASDEA